MTTSFCVGVRAPSRRGCERHGRRSATESVQPSCDEAALLALPPRVRFFERTRLRHRAGINRITEALSFRLIAVARGLAACVGLLLAAGLDGYRALGRF